MARRPYYRFMVAACGVAAIASWVSCGGEGSSGLCSGSRPFPVTAVDDETRERLPSPMFAFEPNGLANESPDPNATYVFGGQGDSNGTFSPPLPCGRWGVHVFANGHRCQSLPTGNTGTLEVGLLALEANTAIPTITDATWSNPAPKAGTQITLTIDVEAASTAPSDRVVAVVVAESTTYRAIALSPVDAPEGSSATTQRFAGRVVLTGTAGTFTYAVVAATKECLASKILRLQLNTSG